MAAELIEGVMMIEDYYAQAGERYVKGAIDPVIAKLIDVWKQSRDDDLSPEEGEFLMTTLAAYEQLIDVADDQH